MRIKNKMLILTLILVSLFMIGAVSAASDTEDIVNSDVSNEKVTTATTNDVSDSSVEKTSKSTDIGTSDSLKKTEKRSTKNDTDTILKETSTPTKKIKTSTSNEDLLKDTNPTSVTNWTTLKSSIQSSTGEVSFILDGEEEYIADGEITIKTGVKVTINGNGKTINAQNKNRMFTVNGELILKNLKLINGQSSDGGAIYANRNSQVNITNTTLTNNTATGEYGMGGAIYAYSSLQVNITNTTFTNNSASRGGATCGKRVTAINCIFTNNTATRGKYCNGGAMYDGTAINCTFNHNTAGSGGAKHSGITINCTFNHNTAGSGGAISLLGNCSVLGCYFINNSAVYGSAISGNSIVGGDANVNYNIFLNDNISIEGNWPSLNLDYNWFGANATNYDTLPVTNYGVATLNYWLFLNVTVRDPVIKLDPTEITFKLYAYTPNNGGEITEYDNSKLTPVNLTITTNNGDTEPIALLGKPITYTPDTIGEGSITASIDRISYTKEVNVVSETSFTALYNNITKQDTITLDHDYTYDPSTDTAYTNGMEINKELTIIGNGHTISGNNTARIFKVTSGGHLTLENITLTKGQGLEERLEEGYKYYVGGAIYINNANITLINTTIQNNNATNWGGAIYAWDNSQVTITQSTLQNNQAIGTLDSGGGAISTYNSQLNINNTTLTNNNSTDDGGAIYADNSQVNINNTTLTNNNATNFGGAIHIANSNITITNTNFIKNTVKNTGSISYGGGAIYADSKSQINIKNTTLQNNNAYNGGAIYTFNSNITITTTTLTNNTATQEGGAIYAHMNSQINIIQTNITNNTATQEGGAIYTKNSQINITNSTLQNNQATATGGAIYTTSKSKINVNSSLFLDNSANNDGGAIYGDCFDELIVNHNIFLNNNGNNVIYLYNKNSGTQKFIYNLNYNWFGNNATDYNINTPAVDSNVENLEFNNWLFLNAIATPNPIIGLDESSDIVFKLSLYNKTATDEDKVSHYNNTQLKPVNLTITWTNGKVNDIAQLGETIRYTPNEYGIGSITASIANIKYTKEIKVARDDSFTALYENITKSTEEITTITLKHNYTYDNTTDQDLQKGIIINKTVHIIGNGYTISGNNTARIFKVTNGGNLTLENITLIKGQGQKETTYYGDQNVGGAISVNNGNLTIINSTLQNNTANNSDGGAIYADNSQVNITNSTLTNNTATNGGAIYEDNNSNITITNSTLQNNTATNGGAIFTWYSNITITNSTLQNNTARHWGGAICVLEETKTSIKSSLFMDNNADVNGGAIYGLNFDELTVNHNIFLNTTKNNIIYLKKNGGAFVYNLDSNWFDNTADNYTNKPNIEFKDIDEPKFDNWLFLNATAVPDLITVLSSSDVSFELFLYNSSSKNVTRYDNSQLKPVNLTLTSVNGNVTNNTVRLGESTKYTTKVSGIGGVTASIGGVSYTQVIKAIKDTSYTALYNNITQSTDPVTIILTQDYIYDPNTDTEFQDGILINKTVIIKGDGHSISGNNTAVIFHVTENGNLTLENITLTNGNGFEGGAISVNNGNLTIINSTLTNNTADEGGAIDAINANVTIINSTFTNNSATYDGGAIFAGASNLTITNTTMSNNTAGENGGAIAIDAINAIKTNIIDSTFINNNATQYGGAIYTNNDLTVENSLFEDNNASRGSGAYIVNALFTSKNNTFINNTVDGENYKIRPRDPQITIPNIADTVEGNPVTITITADEEFNTELVLNVNGNNYTVKMLNGKGQITVSDLKPGTYTARIQFDGNENYTNTTVTSNTFKVNTKPAPSPSPAPADKQNTKIIAKNKVYKPAKYRTYTVTVKNKKGKPVKNTRVKLKIGKKTYIRKTNKKGVATFKIKNTKKSKKSKKTKKYSKITATLNKKNKKDKLTLKRGSKTNKATTNNQGVATFKIKNTKTKTRKYTITLKTTNNKVIKKQKVTLKVKGKTYKAKTNNKGKATFKITNLNKKGKYKTTIKYNGNQNYNKSNKKVKITIKE